jgi:thioredoxin 1
MNKLIEINDLNFEDEVLCSEMPVLVKFGANWCGPCNEQEKVLEKISDEFLKNLKVVQVDIDDSPNLCKQFHIRSVPTMIFFKSGNKIDSNIGFMPLNSLIDYLKAKL